MREACKWSSLFLSGGACYACMELAYRGRTHWTMFVLGGLLFLLIGRLGRRSGIPLVLQAALGAGAVTLSELAAGVVLNLWMGLDIWDYTGLPCNILGQICLPYTLLWVLLSGAAVLLDSWLRRHMWGEPPRRRCWIRWEVAPQRKKC